MTAANFSLGQLCLPDGSRVLPGGAGNGASAFLRDMRARTG